MKRIPGFIAAFAGLLSTALAAAADSSACLQLDYAETLAWSASGADARAGIRLANHAGMEGPAFDEDLYGFLVRAPDSKCLKRIFGDFVAIVATCRDARSGQIHAVIHAGAGSYSKVQIWLVDADAGEPTQEYVEGWVDSYEAQERILVAADGQCRWRVRQAARQAVTAAVQALQIGGRHDEALNLAALDTLPVRPLTTASVQRFLTPLQGIAMLEGAVYASSADAADWCVVQFRGTALCDAPGVVLVLNRRTGQWYSIYDVQSGCSQVLDHPLREMRVHDGHLIAAACVDCSGVGESVAIAINLATWQVRRLVLEDLEQWDPSRRNNPCIAAIDAIVSGD